MSKLTVTFQIESLSTYHDFDTAKNQEASRTRFFAGYLSLETSGYRRLVTADIHGTTLGSILPALVYPREETTREDLEALLAEFPGEFIIGVTPPK